MNRKQIGAVFCILSIVCCVLSICFFIEKKAEVAEKYEIYNKIIDLENQNSKNEEKLLNIEEQKSIIAEKLEPYEERLRQLENFRQRYALTEESISIKVEKHTMFEIPFMLDTSGMLESYKNTKSASAFNSIVGKVGGWFLGFLSSGVDNLEKDLADDEATKRIHLAWTLYELAAGDSRDAERALLEYESLIEGRSGFLETETDGELLSAMQLLEHMGDITEEEIITIHNAEEKVVDALARLDFALNVYYDFSRDTMVHNDLNSVRLGEVLEIRTKISQMLGVRDLTGYGYTVQEKKDLVFPIIDEWTELIDICFENKSPEYLNSCNSFWIPVSGMKMAAKLSYQIPEGTEKYLPKKVWVDNQVSKDTFDIYYSNDESNDYKAYYVKMYMESPIHCYVTDRGEILTDCNVEKIGGKHLKDTDKLWHYAYGNLDGWELNAKYYFE